MGKDIAGANGKGLEKVLYVRFPAAEKERLEAMAREENMPSVSAFCRKILMDAVSARAESKRRKTRAA